MTDGWLTRSAASSSFRGLVPSARRNGFRKSRRTAGAVTGAGDAEQGGAGVDGSPTFGHKHDRRRSPPLPHQRDEPADMRSGIGAAVHEKPSSSGLSGGYVAA